MLALIALIIGFAVGWMRAARRGGDTADRVQYAIAHAIGFALVGLLVSIVIVRLGLFAGF